MSNSSQIRVRPYREGDEHGISKLLHGNFPDTLEPDSIKKTWSWQFRNRFVVSPPVVVAEIDSEIVGQYALMRFPMSYQGATIKGAISTATVTDKRYRGRGLFTRLAERLFEDMERDGCEIVFGFPNAQSIHGFISRLGWFEVNAFPLHLRIVDFFPLARKYLGDHVLSRIVAKICGIATKGAFRRHEHGSNGYEIELAPLGTFPDRMDDPWKTSAISERIGVVRDRRYLEWRYLEKPFFAYELYTVTKHGDLCGCFVTYLAEKFGLRTVYVMECAAAGDSHEVYSAILGKLEDIARKRKADSVSMLLMPSHPQYGLFRKAGFVRVPRKLLPQEIYFAAKVISKTVDTMYLKDPRNWYISWGDLDVV
jgi:GNAT superfamily N-acetyltransferase